LLRNEKYFDLFSFDGGRKIEPDFALFLKKKEQDKMLILQLFIEPKGEDRLISDQWKEDFLKEIFEKNKSELIYQGKEYKLYGLPFYNEKIRKYKFDQSFRQILAFEHKNNEIKDV